jgi:hypothetical protein
MGRNAERAEQVAQQSVGFSQEGREEARVAARVGAEALRGSRDGELQQRCGAVVERMGHRNFRIDPGQAVLGQGQLPEIRAQYTHRVHASAVVVVVARQCELPGAQAPTHVRRRFEQERRHALLRETYGGRVAVGSGADDDRVSALHGTSGFSRAA